MAKLYFSYSTMNAGKSTVLLQASWNYQERGMRTLLFTSALYAKSDDGRITSRIGINAEAELYHRDDDLHAWIGREHKRKRISCVFVDEAQFLTRDQVWQLARVADRLDIPVLCYGLRTDFQGKLYLAGDGAIRDKDTGYFTITGRIDDVLNVSGHRMGTMEIESALVSCTELVAEAAVVGRPDDTTGEAICAFVVLKRPLPSGDEGKAIAKQLRDHIAKEIGPIAKPKDIRFGENLPKTRSGKIMRRLLRSLAKGEEITQDTSTLENPHILSQLGQAY